MAKTYPFDHHLDEYEQWFADHQFVFQSELEAIRRVLPESGNGMEVGIGSGIFAEPLGIKEGIDPSLAMREKAGKRGIKAMDGIAEDLPYPDNHFDFVLMVTTICFVDDLGKSFCEANRVLKNKGSLITGFVDRKSTLGKFYLGHKDENVFYRDAFFWSTEEICGMLPKAGFEIDSILQTVFGSLENIKDLQEPENGHGKGSFVVIRAIKSS